MSRIEKERDIWLAPFLIIINFVLGKTYPAPGSRVTAHYSLYLPDCTFIGLIILNKNSSLFQNWIRIYEKLRKLLLLYLSKN